jgi:hypothetical protein
MQQWAFGHCRQAWHCIFFQWQAGTPWTNHGLSVVLYSYSCRSLQCYLADCYDWLLQYSWARMNSSSKLESFGADRSRRYTTGADQNPAPFISILRNMIPHALNEVRLSDECKMNFSQEVSDFFHSLRVSTREKLHHVPCPIFELPVGISRDSLNQTRAVTLLFVVYYVKRSIVDVPAVRWVCASVMTASFFIAPNARHQECWACGRGCLLRPLQAWRSLWRMWLIFLWWFW